MSRTTPRVAEVIRSRNKLTKAWSEAEFQKAVIAFAEQTGWRTAHFTRAFTAKGKHFTPTVAQAAGYPDLTLVRRDRLVFLELKSERGVVSPLQRDWHEALRKAGQEIHVFRPSQLDKVLEVLR